MLQDGKDINEAVNQILQRNPNIVIVVDELGCGIIPMEAFDRDYREITGRVCCRLAENAKEVHRVICGIGMVLKHA
jgi:adenosyl cobinamide kinase/adenosyl cobinamide phosphate guanylyltransferase